MDEEYPEISTCLGGNTLIQTIDGPVRIKDLCSRGDVVVFTYDHCSKKICLAKTNGGAVKTGENKDVFDVSLDDGRIIRATGNHPFMMRDGSYKRVDELKPYDSLMPFYMRIGRSGYKQVFQPDEDYNARKRWGFVYRLSALYKYGLYPNRDVAVHHIDFNKLNDYPDNIEVLSKNEHGDIHFRNTRKKHGGKIPTHVWTQEERLIQSTRMCGNSFAKGNRFSDEARKLLSDQRTGVKKPEKWRMALAEANQRRKIFLDKSQMAEILSNGGTVADAARYFNVSYATAKRRRVEMFSTQRMVLNHCVLKIEYAGKEDVYDLSVPGYRNFACERVFVHNSLDLYADNATKDRNEAGDPFEVKAKDIRVQNIINEIIERTKVKEMIWDTARAMAKMGDDFDENVVNDKGLIVRLKNLEPYTMFKNVDEYGRVKEKPYVQKDEMTGVTVAEFEPWQIIHWKNGGMKKMYGESVMKSIRRVYKQLQLMEDGMVISRLTRSQLRYKILVDVEGMDKEEREDYIKKVKNEFKKKRLINPLTGKLETAQNPLCLTGDTRIPLLDGRELTICELMSELNDGETFWVYASDGANIVPALATRPWKSGVNAEIVEVKLDNENSVRCTPSHRFMMRDGVWKKANDLCPGDSLMPLYRRLDGKGYELIYPANDGDTFVHTHKVVAAHCFPDIWRHTRLRTTHHKNFKRGDNRPENLEVMSWWDHKKLHVGLLETTFHSPEAKEKSRVSHRRPEYLALRSELSRKQMVEIYADPEKGEAMRESSRKLLALLNYNRNCANKIERIRAYNRLNREQKSRIMTEYNKSERHREIARQRCAATGRKIWEDEEFRKRKSNQVSETMRKLWQDPEYRKRAIPERLARRRGCDGRFLPNVQMVSNHKVISVRPCGRDDVYDLKVEKYHCLALSSGVIVHNSAEEDFYVGVTKESKADVGVLQGATNLGNIRDVEYFQTKLFAGLKVPKAFVGLEKDVKAKCLGLDTRIPCLDDKIQTLREIIDEYEKSGFLPYIYSWDKEKKIIVPGKVIWAGVTKRMVDVVEVKLDDGTKIRCTPEHKWFLLDRMFTPVFYNYLKSLHL
jgi:intein/homing endonuclease